MDVLQSSEEEARKSSSTLHVWTNLTFDNGGGGGSRVVGNCSSPAMVDYSLVKENISPSVAGSSVSFCSSTQIRPPLGSNSVIGNQSESTADECTVVGMISMRSSSAASVESQEPRCDGGGGGNIDCEIEAIEKEIIRLSSRLEYLRLEKEKRKQITAKKAAEKRARFIPAKFMDPQPPPAQGRQNPKKIEESMSAMKTTPRRRGLSMAPSEIARGLTMAAAVTPAGRRGISLGPAEIFSATKSKQLTNQQVITPVYQSRSRRKSCFWKLQEVDELKVIKERGKSMTLSPKSRKTASKLEAANSKQAVTIVGAAKNKSVKKEDGLISSIQPKKLFKDGDKSVPSNKPSRHGRVVASRYKCSNGGNGNGNSAVLNSVRKRSLPDNDKDSKTCDRKRISFSGKSEAVSETRVKKRWEIPSNVLEVPKIKTLQCLNESPRDSGAAKRVSELVGRRSHFSLDEGDREEEEEEEGGTEKSSICQALCFDDEEDEKIGKEYPRIRTLPRVEDSSPRDSGAAKRVSELIGKKSYFSSSEDLEEEISVCQALSFEEEDAKQEQLNISLMGG